MSSVLDRIRDGYYKNADPVPVKPRKPIPVFGIGDSRVKADDLRRHADALDLYEAAMREHQEAYDVWLSKQHQRAALFQPDLEAEFGTTDHPKAAMLYGVAYEYGHAHGMEEIYCHYSNLVDLIR